MFSSAFWAVIESAADWVAETMYVFSHGPGGQEARGLGAGRFGVWCGRFFICSQPPSCCVLTGPSSVCAQGEISVFLFLRGH